MASLFSIKRLVSENLFSRSLRHLPPPAAPIGSFRPFCTNDTPLPPRRINDILHHDVSPYEISKTDDGVVIEVDLPGLTKEDIKVCLDVENNILLIDGETSHVSKKSTQRLEIPGYISFNAEDIVAELKNGMLTLFLPKAE